MELKFRKSFMEHSDTNNETVCPSLMEVPPFLCDQEACRRLQFFSKTALERHQRLSHNARKRLSAATSADSALHICTFQGCQKAFLTHYQLQKHIKDIEGHKVSLD